MKLVKASSAVNSFALYGRGAKPAQWLIVDDDGKVAFEVKGRRLDDGRNVYSVYESGTIKHFGLSFSDVRELVKAKSP